MYRHLHLLDQHTQTTLTLSHLQLPPVLVPPPSVTATASHRCAAQPQILSCPRHRERGLRGSPTAVGPPVPAPPRARLPRLPCRRAAPPSVLPCPRRRRAQPPRLPRRRSSGARAAMPHRRRSSHAHAAAPAASRCPHGRGREEQILEDKTMQGVFCKLLSAWHQVACHIVVRS